MLLSLFKIGHLVYERKEFAAFLFGQNPCGFIYGEKKFSHFETESKVMAS
jgi:hypothetical protein